MNSPLVLTLHESLSFFIWTIERVFFFFQHFSSFSCDDWHLNPQSTFNVCLQSIMDVYFVYCWFAKSMFCVTDNVVSSSVRLCSLLPQGCLIRTFCLCSKSMSYHMSGSSSSACLFSFRFLPLCKTSIKWTRLTMVCLLEYVQ